MSLAAMSVGVTLLWCGAYAVEWLHEPDKRGRLLRGSVTRGLPRPIADVWQIGEMALAGLVVVAACVAIVAWSLCVGVADWLRGGARQLARHQRRATPGHTSSKSCSSSSRRADS